MTGLDHFEISGASEVSSYEKSVVYRMDCMEALKQYPDNYFQLACVDPPYGINIGKKIGGDKPFGSKITHGVGLGKTVKAKEYDSFDDSSIPDKPYFDELFRVSKHQIIWGGNYFIEHLTNTSCMIVWDKDKSGFFADCEIAWTSFETAVRKFTYRWNGMLQQDMKNKEERIHPTQKPIDLYKWIFKTYIPEGGKVLDTHLGSGSSRIAADATGNIDFTAFEKLPVHFTAQEKRWKNYKAQLTLEFT